MIDHGPRIELLENGVVVGTIIADEETAEHLYPGAWQIAAHQELPQPPPPPETPLQTITRLEREQMMPRITREAILRIAEKEAEDMAAELEVDPAVLLAKNKGYTALKAFDNQIAALRAQL